MLKSFSVCSQPVTLTERQAREVLTDLVELDSCTVVARTQDSIITEQEFLIMNLDAVVFQQSRVIQNDSLMFANYRKNQTIYENQIEQARKDEKLWKIITASTVGLLIISLLIQ